MKGKRCFLEIARGFRKLTSRGSSFWGENTLNYLPQLP